MKKWILPCMTYTDACQKSYGDREGDREGRQVTNPVLRGKINHCVLIGCGKGAIIL
jgi:hypothetical protein